MDALVEGGRTMATEPLLTLPPGLITQEITLTARDKSGSVTASILHSSSLPEDERENFVKAVEDIRRQQWRPAYTCFDKREHDLPWNWWGLWIEAFYRHPKEPIEYFVVASAGLIQGMMIVGPTKVANLRSKKKRLLYLAYMATAPWNRRNFRQSSSVHPAALKGVGTELLKQAVCLSRRHGHGGRLGLRAMGRSGTFYATYGMQRLRTVKDTEFDKDPWYEFSEADAREFLRKHGPCSAAA
jgi:hypothetical protein